MASVVPIPSKEKVKMSKKANTGASSEEGWREAYFQFLQAGAKKAQEKKAKGKKK